MRLQTAKAQFAVEFLDLPEAAGIATARWEPFQIGFLNNLSRFAADVKARQIAWSFTAALDAVIDGIINPDTPHMFVSINLQEAAEKIRYAHDIIRALDEPVRPKLIRSNRFEVEFENGSRLISHPCRPPRGKPRARIYLDEVAHYMRGMDRPIYTAALPATVKGDGYIRIGSSPLGASGLLWEIMTETLRGWPGYEGHRRYIPWWCVGALCKDVATAIQVAPHMFTEERVLAFGTTALIEIFQNMFLEDFQQEYECSWIDESVAWISWELIKRNYDDGLLWYYATSVQEAIDSIVGLARAIRNGLIEPVLVGGVDIGRHRDLTEIVLLGKATTGHLPLRFRVSLANVEFDDQRDLLLHLLKELPVTAMLIDESGIGAQLAEQLERATSRRALGVTFTNPLKELWAVEARVQCERGNVPIPVNRDIAYQIHSIKKTTTPSKMSRFDVERNEKHHADFFWGWALAVYAGAQHKGAWGY